MGKSSKDKRDAYYRLAKEQGWRARSAFKLLQLDEEFNLFEDVTRVVDLCAAPGSWSQVLSRVLYKGEKFGRTAWEDKQETLRQHMLRTSSDPLDIPEKLKPEMKVSTLSPREGVKIVAIDLQPMSHLEGITMLRADITHHATVDKLLNALDPSYLPRTSSKQVSHPVDLVLSDGAPDVTGLHDLDIYVQSQLLHAALNLALMVLRPGGKFVAKIFRGRNVDLLYAQMKLFFERVVVAKPRSSRASSVEAFIVCINYKPIPGFVPSLNEPLGVGDRLSDMVISLQQQNPIVAQAINQDATSGAWRVDTLPKTKSTSDPAVEVVLMDNAEDISQGRWIADFIACGDLSSYDADASYHLPKDRISLDPVQPPTAPPYKRALDLRKSAGGAYGKTSTTLTGV